MIDEEYLSQISKVEIYCEILLGILRYTNVKTYPTEEEQVKQLTKKLKFQNLYDFDLFRACIDQMEDAQYAINEFAENGLYISEKRQGEMYLRLYGVLNACYLQVGVITDLIRLFNFQNQKEIREELKKLNAIELRNKIASHTTSYIDENNNFHYYKVAQSSLDKKANGILIVRKNEEADYINLLDYISEFTKTMELYLGQIIDKELYSRTFRKEAFEWMKFRHDFIKKSS
ncbi:hypothetical protein [uncultured Tenacibaculum sp.]|uniref:hypothetical protein n=1 Tax=uncultured Tenacibaculum sp. TaxID=174713 RepID=UPI00263701F2|nr:hypothetical protein [uncultured Tenacibaculum sp.]